MLVRVIVVVCILMSGCTTRPSGKVNRADHRNNGITYSGGSGESFNEAVVISGAKDQIEGVKAEYRFISQQFGSRGSGWHLVGQTVIREKNRIVDVVEIQLGDPSQRRIYYFDASEFLTKKK